MKFLLILPLFLLFTASFSQSVEEVENAVEKLRLSLIDPTADALKALTVKELSYGHSSGTIENQDEFVESLVSGASDFRSIDLSDQTIVFPNKNLALVRHKLNAEVADGGNINTINLGILLIWVKEKGKWKLAARQAFRI